MSKTNRPESRPGRASVKRWLFRIAAVLLGLSPFVVAEGVFRLLDWGRPFETQDPYVGFTAIHPLFVPTADGDRLETAEARLVLFYRDSFAARKSPREYRVFCLGGSTVQGSPYTIETSFTTWLELNLRAADPERKWEVVNCGGLSYASYRLTPILEEVLRHEPDLVILCTGHNEFLEDRSYASVKRTPRWVARVHGRCSTLRTYNLCRAGWLSLTDEPRGAAWAGRTTLPEEVDAWLDHPDGLEPYHRDDAWRDGVVAHFRFNLQRMANLAAAAGVPLVLVNPVSNLKDCPPFKIEPRTDLSPDQRQTFDRLWAEAKSLPDEQRARRLELLLQALAIDDRHAGAHFLLGRCYLEQRWYAEAKQAFVRAKDEDICPLRMLESMHEALAEVANDCRLPMVDALSLFEQQTSDGILGNELLLDHVHPTINGHQMIADELLRELESMGVVQPRRGWQTRRDQLYREHLATLDAPYFARAKERLEGQRRWTEGRVRDFERQ
jgi:lysophospholipase L1-like esterase